MRRVRRCWATVAGVLAALIAAAPASAAFDRAPVDLGPGDGTSPSVAMDPAGTAHVVWGIAEDVMGYCALPRGARTCAAGARFSLDARTGRPAILRRPQDGLLIVLAGRSDVDAEPDGSVWAFTSPDGVTWSGPAQIGAGIGAFDAASLTPDGAAVDLLAADSDVNLFQRAPVAGPPVAATLNLATDPAGATTGFDRPGGLVRMRNGATLAFLAAPSAGFAFRVLTGADPFAAAAWTPWPARRVTATSQEPRGASGPRGTYVMYGVGPLEQAYGASPQVIRRLRGTRWARPRGLLSEVNARTASTDLVQDARGRLHAAIVGTTDSGRMTCIAYARSRRHRWFTRAVSVVRTRKRSARPGPISLAVDARGRGVVAWPTTGTPSVARLQWLKAGRGVTRPRPANRRGCPPFLDD